MKLPDISVIMVEYHSIEDVDGCFKSVNEYIRELEWECVVVSNSQYEVQNFEQLVRRVPGATVVRARFNVGYGSAVNLAIPRCHAPYFLILNPDSRLTDDFLSKMVELMDRNPDIGIVCPRVVGDNGKIVCATRRFPKPWTFLLVRSPLSRFRWTWGERGRYLMEDMDPDQEQDIDWVTGGQMLVRAEAVKDVGAMDDRYFLYMEDVDWCLRFWQKGWRVHYTPCCEVFHSHKHGSTRAGLRAVRSRHFWFHLASLLKFFNKWGWSSGFAAYPERSYRVSQ